MSDITPTTPELPAAAVWLQEHGIPHRLIIHHGPVHSLEQAAAERGQKPDQIVRSILFRLNEDEFIMVLVAGSRQIDWKSLRRLLNTSRLSMASPEEVLLHTGANPGAVSPFGLPHPLRILIDSSVTQQHEVSLGSGRRGTAVILHVADLLTALSPTEIVNLAQKYPPE